MIWIILCLESLGLLVGSDFLFHFHGCAMFTIFLSMELNYLESYATSTRKYELCGGMCVRDAGSSSSILSVSAQQLDED